MWAKPSVGQRLRVVTRHKNIYIWSTDEFQYHTYEGRVVPSNSWDSPSSFKLHTGRPEHPDSIIELRMVHAMESLDGTDVGQQRESSASASWTVKGSKGQDYTVTQEGSKYTCTCPGFQFRRNCRHIGELVT